MSPASPTCTTCSDKTRPSTSQSADGMSPASSTCDTGFDDGGRARWPGGGLDGNTRLRCLPAAASNLRCHRDRQTVLRIRKVHVEYRRKIKPNFDPPGGAFFSPFQWGRVAFRGRFAIAASVFIGKKAFSWGVFGLVLAECCPRAQRAANFWLLGSFSRCFGWAGSFFRVVFRGGGRNLV